MSCSGYRLSRRLGLHGKPWDVDFMGCIVVYRGIEFRVWGVGVLGLGVHGHGVSLWLGVWGI